MTTRRVFPGGALAAASAVTLPGLAHAQGQGSDCVKIRMRDGAEIFRQRRYPGPDIASLPMIAAGSGVAEVIEQTRIRDASHGIVVTARDRPRLASLHRHLTRLASRSHFIRRSL